MTEKAAEPAASSETEPAASNETEPAASSETEPAASSETEPAASSETEPAASSETEPAASSETEPPAVGGDIVVVATRRAVIRDCLGVGLAVGAYGVAFGAASVSAGLTVLQTVLMSLLAFTGGTQFAVVGVLAAGGGIAAALSNGLLLGSRNLLYAMRLAPLLRVSGGRRLLAALGTIDESTAMAVAQPDEQLGRAAFWWTFGAVYTFWNLATLLGAAGASALGDPTRFGLDAVVPAAFLALLAPRLRNGAVERRIAFAAALVAFALIPVAPPGIPVLASCAALVLAGPLRRLPGLRRRRS